jgi:hypothetical protein
MLALVERRRFCPAEMGLAAVHITRSGSQHPVETTSSGGEEPGDKPELGT